MILQRMLRSQKGNQKAGKELPGPYDRHSLLSTSESPNSPLIDKVTRSLTKNQKGKKMMKDI